MRIIALGDTHGRTLWEKIIAKEPANKIVFIGDYFDTHEDVTPDIQYDNFKNILSFKKAYPDKVILLFGNHDFHYLASATEWYSGYQLYQRRIYQRVLQPAVDKGLLQMCFVFDKLLFTHAGVTRTWSRDCALPLLSPEEEINTLFKEHPEAFEFTPGLSYDPSGDDPEQPPVWVRPRSLLSDRIEGYTQIVEHTVQERIVLSDEVIFIDTLGTSREYLVWEDGTFDVGRL